MTARNPFLIEGPAVISFSGGRTSGFMLWSILQAHDGKLPGDVRVIFCNTGKEREETLQFVERCSLEWNVPITWLEYRWEPGRHYFVEVNYATASRKGEPFEMVVKARGFLPNPVMRFCTAELKSRTTNRFIRSLGWERYLNAIGLRADEERRVAKMLRKRQVQVEQTLFGEEKTTVRASDLPPGETPVFPLHEAGMSLEHVMEFWARQPFDLQLRQDEGNCDLCFLKGAAKLVKIIEERPASAEWWIGMEQAVTCRDKPETERFRADRPAYAELLAIAQGKEEGPGWLWADKGNVGACGEIDECRCTD